MEVVVAGTAEAVEAEKTEVEVEAEAMADGGTSQAQHGAVDRVCNKRCRQCTFACRPRGSKGDSSATVESPHQIHLQHHDQDAHTLARRPDRSLRTWCRGSSRSPVLVDTRAA